MKIRLASAVVVSVPLMLAWFPACSSSTNVVNNNNNGDDGGTAAETGTGTETGTGGTQCTAARKDLLLPIEKVSTGEVKVVSETGGVKTIFVDASAGGFTSAIKNPRIYVDLSAGARVDVTDGQATTSADWDLALKRVVIFTNGGDAGTGQGGGVALSKSFAAVTAADADAATIAPESFFDGECVAKKDPTGDVLTTFSSWYDYDDTTRIPTPRNVTFIVKGGKGKRFKVGIKAYDGKPDGTTTNNMSTGGYLLQVAEL